jgi:hypothetical protein
MSPSESMEVTIIMLLSSIGSSISSWSVWGGNQSQSYSNQFWEDLTDGDSLTDWSHESCMGGRRGRAVILMSRPILFSKQMFTLRLKVIGLLHRVSFFIHPIY